MDARGHAEVLERASDEAFARCDGVRYSSRVQEQYELIGRLLSLMASEYLAQVVIEEKKK